jgi:hypothetical protein
VLASSCHHHTTASIPRSCPLHTRRQYLQCLPQPRIFRPRFLNRLAAMVLFSDQRGVAHQPSQPTLSSILGTPRKGGTTIPKMKIISVHCMKHKVSPTRRPGCNTKAENPDSRAQNSATFTSIVNLAVDRTLGVRKGQGRCWRPLQSDVVAQIVGSEVRVSRCEHQG